MISLAVDIGGTFTDLIAFDDASNRFFQAKSLTTPRDPVEGIIDCIRKSGIDPATIDNLIHGSTIAINTLIERKGATVGLIVTQGSRDVYSIGRGNRPEAYNLFFHRPQPLVPRRRTLEVSERLYASGEVLEPLNLDDVRIQCEKLKQEGVNAVAVCFLHAYQNPSHEQAAGKVVQEILPNAFVSLSHEILREYREYERMSTTVVNSYIGPTVGGYVQTLQTKLAGIGFKGELAIMQSNGGVTAPAAAIKRPATMMESGPVGGIIAGAEIGRSLRLTNLVSFDMGGTTAKASLVRESEATMAEGYYVGGYANGHPVMIPVVDVVEVGAGGGSIAWIDEIGALKVGPQSAGSEPGPISYRGGGTEPTITDANVVLGRIGAQDFLGGEMPLDRDGAMRGVSEKIGRRLGMDAPTAAHAIIQIAIAKMSLAVREVSVQKGYDPREFVLVASGGAGAPHAVPIARELHIPTVVIPRFPSHFSALGMLMTDERHDLIRTFWSEIVHADFKALRKNYDEMVVEASRLVSEGKQVDYQALLDLRYVGQEFTLTTPVTLDQIEAGDHAGIRKIYDELHERRYAHHAPDEPIEIVAIRLVARGRRPKLTLPPLACAAADAIREHREVYFDDTKQPVCCPVYDREKLRPGASFDGPALVSEYGTTTVVFGGDKVTVAETGELVISVGGAATAARAISTTQPKLDPVTLEVIRNALPAIANEMAADVYRTSYNMMIYEVRDFCTTLTDAKGRLVAQNVGGVSHFVADLGVIVQDAMARYGADGFTPDDVIITNHQAVAGQHLNNVVIYMPYFYRGELLLFSLVRAHWIDIGGQSTGFGAGNVTDPWAEGLQLDQLKIYENGKPNQVLLKVLRDNIRFPDASLGDLRSQIAGCRLAHRRLDELFEKFGKDVVLAAIDQIFTETDLRCRRIVEALPEGVYEHESFVDGATPDERLRIHAKVTIKGGEMEIDLSGCAGEQKAAINSRTYAGARVAYKCLTLPFEPVNEGSFTACRAIIPEGNIMMARYPAPMSNWSNVIPTVVDTIITALAGAIPDRVPAAHMGLLGAPVIFFGTHPKTGNPFIVQSLEGGGWGGRPHEDGESGSVSICQGDVRNGTMEGIELQNPVVVLERALRPGSGGAGKFRGGLGVDLKIRNLVEGRWNLNRPRRINCPPWGLWGGKPGGTAAYLLKLPTEASFQEVNLNRHLVPADSEVIVRTGGGGGWGDPLERDPARVLDDVGEGFISIEQARDLYGVALKGSAPPILDHEATEQLRGRARESSK